MHTVVVAIGGKAAIGMAAVVVGMTAMRTEIGKARVGMEVLVTAVAVRLGKIGIGTIAGERGVGGAQARGITVVVGRSRVRVVVLSLILLGQ